MKFLKAMGAFVVYYFLMLLIISIIIPESILKNPLGGLFFFFGPLALSIYIAIKAYKLNTMSLTKIFKSQNKNSQTQIKKEIDFIKNLSKNNSSALQSTSSKKKIQKKLKTNNEKKADIEIIYQKPNGEISTRKVKVEKVDESYLYGYCFLRNDERTFNLNRILKLKNLKTLEELTDTNEIIDYLQWLYGENGNQPSIEEKDKTFKTRSGHIDDGYFYGKVEEPIIDLKKDFNVIYSNGIEETLYFIRFGKLKYNDEFFILAINIETDEFSGLYADKIIEMHDLETGEIIYDANSYLKEIYNEELKKYNEKEAKRQQKEKMENFIDDHLDLLKMLVYIAKSDGTINSKEKDILIETLEEHFPDIIEPNKIIDKIAKNHLYFKSYNAFARNTKQIIENYPEINFLEFAERIVSTQKSIHSDEEKILNFLSKIYNREYQLNYESSPKGQRTFDNEPCPHCGSNHTIKKGKRKYKDYVAQRYQCQDCGKIFSIKESDNE